MNDDILKQRSIQVAKNSAIILHFMVRGPSSSGEDRKVDCNTKEGTTLKLVLCNYYEQCEQLATLRPTDS